MGESAKIKKVEIFTYGDPESKKIWWCYKNPSAYLTHTVVKLTSEEGYVGLGSNVPMIVDGFDNVLFEAAKQYPKLVLGKSALDREGLWYKMMAEPNMFAMQPVAMFDIALWDIAAQKAGMPLYKMLGACRDKILAYASTETYETIPEYLKSVGDAIDEGYKAIKLHCYGIAGKDAELVTAVQKEYGDRNIKFMLDPDLKYDREGSMMIAKIMEDYGWCWLESPTSDYDLVGYRNLVKKTNIPISCGGNLMLSLTEIANCISQEAWVDVRADTSVNGGITPMRKIMHLAEANSMRCEVQSWGDTIQMAANLHIMLPHHNCTFFEHAYPHINHDLGAKNPFRIDNEGYIHAPSGNGLGVELDWEVIEKYKNNYYCAEL